MKSGLGRFLLGIHTAKCLLSGMCSEDLLRSVHPMISTMLFSSTASFYPTQRMKFYLVLIFFYFSIKRNVICSPQIDHETASQTAHYCVLHLACPTNEPHCCKKSCTQQGRQHANFHCFKISNSISKKKNIVTPRA